MALHEVDPISRIEGHLGVKLTTDDGTGRVTVANVHGNLWRGFENFLIGRDPNDAITFTQRICGVCPIPHATASTFAVESVLGYNQNGVTFVDDGTRGVPAKAVHIRNLVYASEFVMSHITHFYHLAAPSYIQGPNVPPWTPFFADSYYHPFLQNSSSVGTGNLTGVTALSGRTTLPSGDANGFSTDLWSAVIRSYVKALRMRRLTFEAGALFAGRMPMTSSFVAGGVTNDTLDGSLAARCAQFKTLMAQVGTFVVKEYVPIALALGALYPNYDNYANAMVAHSVTTPVNLWHAASPENATTDPVSGGTGRNTGYGAGFGNFLSWGAFPRVSDDALTISGGWIVGAGSPTITFGNKSQAGTFSTAVASNLREHITHSNYADSLGEFTGGAAYPGSVSRTEPDRTGGTKYSWLKAPRWNGNAMEVGPYARMAVNGWVPVDGSTTYLSNGVKGLFGTYVKTNGSSVTGLNPRFIEPDVAVALVKAQLATVTVGAGPATTDLPTIIANYGNAEAVITGTIFAWISNLTGGLSTMDRLRARALECLVLIVEMIGAPSAGAGPTDVAWTATTGWIDQLAGAAGGTYIHKATPTATTSGFGVSEAPRGALAHFVTIENGLISKYQCVVPTTWNACPKDNVDGNGPMEEAMMGIPFDAAGGSFTNQAGGTSTTQGGVEALRVAQSFDPCIACAVH